ncbi:MAG: 3-isopropylmalate dehydratase small subunit [Verrucomicrobia bacterium]|nr:MAG: 3-isopropylmalate dehydratase small subunit [Verrucomicrobiota bacterium]
MALQKILTVTGTAVHIPGDDIDTDRIIPARFLKCVTFDDLGQYAFWDERFTSEGTPKPHPLNAPEHQAANILITGSNFGCGSSREHAPQALYRHGIRVIVAESYAEIFFGNSITLGMPCISLERESLRKLTELVDSDPTAKLTIDVVSCKIAVGGDKTFQGSLPEHARNALIEGNWDPISELLDGVALVKKVAERLPYFHA